MKITDKPKPKGDDENGLRKKWKAALSAVRENPGRDFKIDPLVIDGESVSLRIILMARYEIGEGGKYGKETDKGTRC